MEFEYFYKERAQWSNCDFYQSNYSKIKVRKLFLAFNLLKNEEFTLMGLIFYEKKRYITREEFQGTNLEAIPKEHKIISENASTK